MDLLKALQLHVPNIPNVKVQLGSLPNLLVHLKLKVPSVNLPNLEGIPIPAFCLPVV